MLRHRAAGRALSALAGGCLPPAADTAVVHAAVPSQQPVQPHVPAALPPAARSFYKRQLPRELIPFASQEGKRIFRDALDDGSVESFFPLVQHFQTQSEPASCALGTLCMVLNACGIDPGQSWKGPWRWWSEEVLLQRWDTATEGLPPAQRRAVADVRGSGMSLAEFTLLSRAAGLHAVGRRADSSSKGAFQEAVFEALGCGVGCGGSPDGRTDPQAAAEEHRHTPFGGRGGTHVVASFDRAALRQTGQGHFSPLGGYSRRHGAVLVMDVARFKYPPYWCSLDALWEAMLLPDPATGVSRGYVVLKATDIPRDSDRCPVGGLLPPPAPLLGARRPDKRSDGGHAHSHAHSHGPAGADCAT